MTTTRISDEQSHGGPAVVFDFEGRTVTARQGDTIAAALIADGLNVFGRSWKYHRPRGYRCGHGHCSACSMRVDGLPGVRTCVTPARAGMKVEREHALPSADHDVLQAAGLFAPLMPPGFYYRWFRHSPRLWGVFERGLSRVSGQGDMPSPEAVAQFGEARCERRERVDVLVIGGGLAGLSAALAAAEAGADVMLAEQDDRLGGRALDLPVTASEPRLALELVAKAIGHPRIEVLTAASAVGWYDENIVAIDRAPDLLVVAPREVVLASGGYDLGLPFPGWDKPGVMLAAGARRLLHRHGVKPGRRAAVITTNDLGYDLAAELAAAGIELACLIDSRPRQAIRSELVDRTDASSVPMLSGATSAQAHGLNRVASLSVRPSDQRRPIRYGCDLVCISAGVRPADDLDYQARADGSVLLSSRQSNGRWEPIQAGLVAGTKSGTSAMEQGAQAGKQAAFAAEKGGSRLS